VEPVVEWCSAHRLDPARWVGAKAVSLKVYVAAIAAHHDTVEDKSLGKHELIVRFGR